MIGAQPIDKLTAQDVADVVAVLHEQGIARGTIRKTAQAVAMVLDDAGITPKVARDRVTVRLPREEVEELNHRRPNTPRRCSD